MDADYLRRKHRRLPPHEHRPPGPLPIVGPQEPLAIPVDVRLALGRLARSRSVGPIARYAYSLGRAALMARLTEGDRWDKATTRGGRGKLTSIAMPSNYLHGWPTTLCCTHGAACRLAIDIGVELLEWERQAVGYVEILDERSVDPIHHLHHPDRYYIAAVRDHRDRSGTTWLG